MPSSVWMCTQSPSLPFAPGLRGGTVASWMAKPSGLRSIVVVISVIFMLVISLGCGRVRSGIIGPLNPLVEDRVCRTIRKKLNNLDMINDGELTPF